MKHFTFNLTCILFFILMMFSASLSYSQTKINDKIKEDIKVADQFVRSALTDRKGYHLLKELTDMGSRLSGSENSVKAIMWAKKKMEEDGFDKVWLQPVMVPHWVRGKVEQAEIVKSKLFKNRKLNIATLGGSIGTGKSGISAEVLEVKNFDELKALRDKAKGKIIFMSRPLDPGIIQTFRGYGQAVDQRVFGAMQAAKLGAVGVMIRSITTKYDNVPHTGVMIYNDTIPKIPAVALGYQDADFISNALKKDPHLEVNIKLDCKTLPDAQSYNLIGELTGSEFPDQVIVVGGHSDSWDKGVGANDDGTGIMQSMEVVDLFKRLDIKPKRTIRCVFFINEENGSRGGEKYGEYAKDSPEKHIAAIEADAGSGSPRGFSIDADSLTIANMQSWLPVLRRSDIDWVEKGGSGADVGEIKNAKARIGYIPDPQRYFDYHHSDNDQFAIIHPREFELGSSAMATLVYMIDQYGL
ncbi:MAG: M20/M25/M40 family metallo-hydrolase [Ignavibacteriaceae bacterium]